MEGSLTATAYLLATDAARRATIASDVALGLEKGGIKLTDVVVSMQEPLFAEEADQRAAGMAYLAAILKNLDRSALSRANVALLVKFVESRLELDPSGAKEATQCLRHLSTMKRFDSSSAADLIAKVYNATHTNFKSTPVMSRFEVYRLLDELLSHHRLTIKATGVDFINILIELSASERDPRNLMLIFSMVEVVLAEWDDADTEQLAEDLYDLLSRYFPITFSAKKTDPAGINPAELVLRLRKCFAAYSGFAPSLFPNLIQRLDDPNRLNAKADVLLTMKACVKRYEPVIVAQWSTPLWDALKYEIFNSSDDSHAPKALKVLRAVASRLSVGCTIQTLNGTLLQSYIDAIVEECMNRIRENGPKYGKSAGEILSTVETASPFAYHLVIRSAMPALIREFSGQDANVDEKRALVEVMNQLLDGKLEIFKKQLKWPFGSISIIDGISSDADTAAASGEDVGIANGGLSYYRDDLTAIFMGIARDTESADKFYRTAAFQGLSKLLKLPQYLERHVVDMYIQYLSSCILEMSDLTSPVRKEVVRALQDCAVTYSSYIIDSTFPVLLTALPDTLGNEERVPEYLAVLEALGDIASRGPLIETLFRRLLSKLDIVVHGNDTQKYSHLILAGILYTVEQRQAQKDLDTHRSRDVEALSFLAEELLRRVGERKIHAKRWYTGIRDVKTAAGNMPPDDKFLDLVGRIIMTSICSMSAVEQGWIYDHALSLGASSDEVVTARVELVQNGDGPTEDEIIQRRDIDGGQFDLQAGPADKLRALILTKYMLAGLRREKPLLLDIKRAVTNLINFLIEYEDSQAIRSSLLDLLAILINKFGALKPSGTSESSDPTTLITSLTTDLASKPPKIVKNTIQILCTITHAALLAGLPLATTLTNDLLTGLSLPAPCGPLFAQSFSLLLAPHPLLTPTNHAVTRTLAKHRLFSACVPTLLTTYPSLPTAEKTNSLIALSGILANVPGDFITPHIDTLVPLLLHALDIGSSATKKASISVLRAAAATSPAALEAHDTALIKRLLACAKTDRSRETKVAALECLTELPVGLGLSVVVKHKKSVVAGLGDVVGDSGRDVRRWAVDCLAAWWRVGEAEEP